MTNFSGYSNSKFNEFNLSDDEIKANFFASERENCKGGYYSFIPRSSEEALDSLNGKFQIDCSVKIANEYFHSQSKKNKKKQTNELCLQVITDEIMINFIREQQDELCLQVILENIFE
jgi:hypothetical protein